MGDFWRFLGPLEPRWDPISFSRHPMNDNFIFGTLNHVCTKETFDSMYGWYGSNGNYMWKIANFGDFWWFFGPLEPRWDPICFFSADNCYFVLFIGNLVFKIQEQAKNKICFNLTRIENKKDLVEAKSFLLNKKSPFTRIYSIPAHCYNVTEWKIGWLILWLSN